MRTIKFRVWDGGRLSFRDPTKFAIAILGDGRIIYNHGQNDLSFYKPEGNDLVVEFFTGLFDKNNKEIFEGDIVRFDAYGKIVRTPIIFIKGKFVPQNFCWYEDCPCEVIGNIHENCSESIPKRGPAQCKNGHWLGSKEHPVT